MTKITGLSGNEIYCLNQKKLTPGNIVVGNSIYSLGLINSIGSGVKAFVGGEVTAVTKLISDGRQAAYQRMLDEAIQQKAAGITGVTSELIFHGSNLEFLSIGSVVNKEETSYTQFSTSANGQELYAQMDAGYHPICFAFGNVAYSIGVGRGLIGGLKTFTRGEIREYSDIFNHTRHLALQRIIQHAKENKANAVLGIKTTILSVSGVNEMLMIGTASSHPQLNANEVITSDMTNIEMWNMAQMGYAPMRLVLGTSVYSLGFIGSVTSLLKSFVRGEINELTRLIYDARENALAIIKKEAEQIGADDVIGVNTYVYNLGNGLIEFLAIGTAVRKTEGIKPASDQLPPQAIIVDESTFYSAAASYKSWRINANRGEKPINNFSFVAALIFVIIFMFVLGLIR